ncbi:MAG: ARMT1-like domain-containing protein [Methanomassiliicoccaceae archaeon]|nr:ARMT1-like domain-containing protein [Methanomassiliicoccaceae archaeon]
MEIRPECVPCLLKRVLFQAELADNGSEMEALKAAMDAFSRGLRKGRNSAEIATEVHRAAYRAMNVKDPYLELKIRADAVAGEFIDTASHHISSSGDPVRAAMLIACIGNIMDFGIEKAIDDPDRFREEFNRLIGEGLGHDDTDIVKDILSKAKSIVYLFDNCGESQLDKLLIREIRKKGIKVTGVVRGAPILNDVAIDDAYRTGLDKELDGLYTTSEFRIGIDMNAVDTALREEMASADLMIAKGMANFESLSDQNVTMPIAYIMRTKCAPVADALKIPLNTNAVIVRGRTERKKDLP